MDEEGDVSKMTELSPMARCDRRPDKRDGLADFTGLPDHVCPAGLPPRPPSDQPVRQLKERSGVVSRLCGGGWKRREVD